MLPVSIEPLTGPHPLRNDGRLELFFIGVGNANALRHFQTNFLIVKGDTHIMVDFGTTGDRALWATAQRRPEDIDVILPTHSHGDHVGGIESIALANRYGGRFKGRPKTTMIVTAEYLPMLWNGTLKGGLELNEKREGHNLDPLDFFEIIHPEWQPNRERPVFRTEFRGITLELFRTMHIPSGAESWEDSATSYGLFIDDHVFVSVDTRFDKELIRMYADRSSVMFHDVTFGLPEYVHAPLELLNSKLPTRVTEKMFLMHYPDNWEQFNISPFAGWAQQGVRYLFDQPKKEAR